MISYINNRFRSSVADSQTGETIESGSFRIVSVFLLFVSIGMSVIGSQTQGAAVNDITTLSFVLIAISVLMGGYSIFLKKLNSVLERDVFVSNTMLYFATHKEQWVHVIWKFSISMVMAMSIFLFLGSGEFFSNEAKCVMIGLFFAASTVAQYAAELLYFKRQEKLMLLRDVMKEVAIEQLTESLSTRDFACAEHYDLLEPQNLSGPTLTTVIVQELSTSELQSILDKSLKSQCQLFVDSYLEHGDKPPVTFFSALSIDAAVYKKHPSSLLENDQKAYEYEYILLENKAVYLYPARKDISNIG